MVTILAFNTGKAVVENAAVKISVDNLPHIRPEKAILLGKALIVILFQRFKIVLNALIILRVLWFTWLINGRRVGHGLFFLKQDEDMHDSLYCKLN
jgi:hypothetical protein